MTCSITRLVLWLALVVSFTRAANPLAAHPGSGIEVDREGQVYFTDSADGVRRIDKAGKLHLLGGSAFHWMTIDPAGKFANAPDSFGEWFERPTPRGATPTLVTCSDFPCVVASDGNLYFAKQHQFTIIRRTPDGVETTLAKHPKPEIWSVTGLAAGPGGTLYAMAVEGEGEKEAPCAVFKITPDGKITPFATGFAPKELPPDERDPEGKNWYGRGLDVDAAGNVYVAMTGSRCVLKLPIKGEPSVVLRSQKPWTPTGVTLFDGAVYVLEYDDETPAQGREWPARVRRVDWEGGVQVLAEVRVKPDAKLAPTSR